MESIGRRVILGIATLISVACTSCQGPACTRDDPFLGFYAAPSQAMLELKRASDGKYHGSFWSDGGPFAVDLTRDGNVARGTVNIGGVRPMQAESTPQGLILTIDGDKLPTPLHCYRSPQEYQNSGDFRTSVGFTTSTTQP